ncbi:MAG: hypothetical protein HKN95_04190 [Acidimicrobiia bacterium]|jgi:aromatic ring hydroxylase|nr:hypothetical protein [Acidimicrobiia bacterium]
MFQFVTGYVMGTRQAGKAAGLAGASASFASAETSKIHNVNDRLDRLVIVVEAMWSLLEESGHTREQLEERILAMDAADGATDGRVQRGKLRCPGCDSVVLEGSGRCQICGREVGEENPFAGI